MRSSNMNSRVPEPVLSAESHGGLEIESVLRIRPLLRKERDDAVMLEPLESTKDGPETVVLNPLHSGLTSPVASSSLRNRADSDATSNNVPTEYHFNHVLEETTNQDKLYYTIGHPIASDTMRSLKTAAASRSYTPRKTMSHLLLCMGVSNSGKTFTCFGGTTIPKRRAAQDGLVPRLMDSLFSQSKHNTSGTSKGFAVQISMVQVTQPVSAKAGIDTTACQLHDLLAFAKTKAAGTPSKHKTNMTVRNMAARFERAVTSPVGRQSSGGSSKEEVNTELTAENPKPTIESARDATQAREMLQNGLNASEKLSNGNQNFHICVTMQPVLDGTKYGDKIVVLDMAGLEKEKRGNGSGRKHEIVSSLNQMATAAVMRCLRVMTHNDNIASGKGNFIGFSGPDDDVSEISFVSQAKDPLNRQMKPVPFRQHKITMLLNPLFVKSSLVKVKIVLTAYPGHSDLQQKRMLMQDIELLHGSSLVPPLSAIVETGLEHVQSSDSTDSESRDDESSNGSIENKQTHATNVPSNGRSLEREHPPRSRNIKSNQPGAPKASRHYSGVTSKAIRVEKVENRLASKSRVQRRVQPSAPMFSEATTPNRDELSDFPGVDIPSSIGKSQMPVLGRRSIETTGVVHKEPVDNIGTKPRSPSRNALGELPGYSNDPSNRSPAPHFPTVIGRMPLERSSLENSMNCVLTEQEEKTNAEAKRIANSGEVDQESKNHQVTTQEFTQQSSFGQDTINNTTTKPDNEESAEIKRLEKKLQESNREKHALERICAQLEKENAELRNEAREAGRKVLQTQWTEQDEDAFMASRKMRREAQNLIKAPIQEHLEKVNYVYEIKNQWCMTNKQHFSLQFPNRFQRAKELNQRDKAKKEAENDQDGKGDHQAIRQTQSEDNECTSAKRLSYGVTKPRQSLVSLPQKTGPQPPRALSALKSLRARRSSKY